MRTRTVRIADGTPRPGPRSASVRRRGVLRPTWRTGRAALLLGLVLGVSLASEGRAASLHGGDLVIAGALGLQVVDPGTGGVTPLVALPGDVTDVAVGPRQDVYVLVGNEILRIDAPSGFAIPVAVGGWLDVATRLVREPSGFLLVLTNESPAEPSNPPPGFHWSRVVRIDPGSGAQALLAEGGYLDRAIPSPGERVTDLDVLADGRIVLSRYAYAPILFTLDPVSGAQSVLVDAPVEGGWLADYMAVDPRGTAAYAFGADWGQCWCTRAIDLATWVASGTAAFSYPYPPAAGIGHAGDVVVGPDGTAYNLGYNSTAAGDETILTRWNPSTGESGIVSHLPSSASAISMVPWPACSNGIDDDGDGLVDLADPGCADPTSSFENPPCQDGIDNDHNGRIDFDGGASAHGGVPLAPPDPQCTSAQAWEGPTLDLGCGLGGESVIVLPLAAWLRGRRRRHGAPAAERPARAPSRREDT